VAIVRESGTFDRKRDALSLRPLISQVALLALRSPNTSRLLS
jgi:hypothetical protein